MIKVQYLGVFGCVVALIACVSDLILLYTPNAQYEVLNYTYFLAIEQWRIPIAHFLGVTSIPLELVGMLLVYAALKPAGSKWVLPIMGVTVYLVIIGTAYHAMLSQMAGYMHSCNEAPLLLKQTIDPMTSILYLTFALLSIGLFYVIRYKTTHYPKYFAWVNPLLIHIVLALIYWLEPVYGGALLVTGLNLSVFILLFASTLVLWDKDLTL